MKPIIGIVAKHSSKDERPNAKIQDSIKNAILDCGGIAIGILPTETNVQFTPPNSGDKWDEYLTEQQKQDLISQIKLCDGIILQSGADSLKYESWIAKYTFDNDIPTLGFCAGQNNMIRGVGGTTKPVENLEKHYQKGVDEAHKIFIKKQSKFFEIVQVETMPVNSRHKRVIDNPTDKYQIAAVCEDGNFDVLEATNKKFNFAIRFHPENLYQKFDKHRAIFETFIKACKK